MLKKQSETINELECTIVRDAGVGNPQVAVILCHGFGAPGQDLVSLAREFFSIDGGMEGAVFIFPAAPLELDPGYDSRAWWMIDVEKIQQLAAQGLSREMSKESPDRLPECRELLNGVIAQVQERFSLPADKIVIGGFSQGAMLATDVALHFPETLGGLIVWSGALICESEWTTAAKIQSPLNVVQTHGTLDPILPIAGARLLHAALTQAGHTVEYQEFEGQHMISGDGLAAAAALIKSLI
jgi:phospholipase/carboxylesterase